MPRPQAPTAPSRQPAAADQEVLVRRTDLSRDGVLPGWPLPLGYSRTQAESSTLSVREAFLQRLKVRAEWACISASPFALQQNNNWTLLAVPPQAGG